jgi:hypothetical protein
MRGPVFNVTALGLLAFSLFAMAGDAVAQQRDRRCAPNYPDVCYKACVERGGQARHCPTYCQQQQREAKCG